MDFSGLGRMLIFMGLLLAAFGLLITVVGKVPGLFRLPGDIVIKREGFVFYFPLATSLLISVVLTLLLWLLRR